MAAERVGDMTMEELLSIIRREVNARQREDERIKTLLAPPEDHRTVRELLDDIDKHMWTPPPGSPSTLELLREDRDR